MGWFKIELSLGEVADGTKLLDIQEAFADIHIEHLAPEDAALFSETASHGGQILYFSPGAARIAPDLLGQIKASPCPQPKASRDLLDGIGLLVGDAESFDLLATAE